MEIEITERRPNDLMEREEIELDITHSGEATPSEQDVRKRVAAELDLDPTTIRVDHIYSATGIGTSSGQVTVFNEPIMDELPEDGADENEDGESGGERTVEVDIDEGETDEADEDESEAEDADAETADDDEAPEEGDD